MTVTDPFAAAPEEAQTDYATPREHLRGDQPWDAEPKKALGSISVDVKPNVLPLDNGKVVLTFKGGTGFDAPWIVIHATSLDDAHAQVTGENASVLATVMGQVHKAASHFASNGPVNTGRGGNTSGASAPPQGATEAPSWAPAKHQPDAVYKTGVSKAGKTWHAWMSPQKGGYEPKFFYND